MKHVGALVFRGHDFEQDVNPPILMGYIQAERGQYSEKFKALDEDYNAKEAMIPIHVAAWLGLKKKHPKICSKLRTNVQYA